MIYYSYATSEIFCPELILQEYFKKCMNKDAILATLIGFGIGLVITGIFLLGPNLVKTLPSIKFPTISFTLPKINIGLMKKSQSPPPIPSPVPSPDTLSIDNPLADMIITKSEVLVSGKAPAGSTIVLQSPIDESVAVAHDDGSYAGTLILTEGKNSVSVTAYHQEKVLQQLIIVFYTPEIL